MEIREIKSTENIFNSIKLGDWIEVTTKPRNDYSDLSTLIDYKLFLKTKYFFEDGVTEYVLDRKDFITIEDIRDNKLNELGI